MKSLIISDLHGIFYSSMIEDAEKFGIKRLICLGDYDDPQLLRTLRNIDMDKIILPGNHDWALCTGYDFHSQNVEDCEKVAEEWDKFPEERKYILEAKNTFEERIKEKRVCYLHGALAPDSSMENDVTADLWGRIQDDELKLAENFKRMNRNGYWILFRGHDHYKNVFSIEKNFRIHKDELAGGLTKVILGENRKYIVTVGTLQWGNYCVFDSEIPSIRFGTMV